MSSLDCAFNETKASWKGIPNARFTRPNWFLSRFFFDTKSTRNRRRRRVKNVPHHLAHSQTWFIDCNNICHTSYNQTIWNYERQKCREKIPNYRRLNGKIKPFSMKCLCVDSVLFPKEKEKTAPAGHDIVLKKVCEIDRVTSNTMPTLSISNICSMALLFRSLSPPKTCHITWTIIFFPYQMLIAMCEMMRCHPNELRYRIVDIYENVNVSYTCENCHFRWVCVCAWEPNG